MPKGVLVAHQANADGRPTFVTGGRVDKWRTTRTNRLHYFMLGGRRDTLLHFFQMKNAAGGVLEIGAQLLKVYWVTAQGVSVARARNILKWLRTNSTVQTIQELRDDTRPVADTVRASPDIIRPLSHDPTTGAYLTTDTYLMHTVFGQDHGALCDGTTAAEIDGATAEPLGAA